MIHPSLTPGPIGTRDVIAAVDCAVRAVLKELGTNPKEFNGDVFAERLLSLRHAEELSRGVREVRIAPGTVVTPLARDFFKSRGIMLRWVPRVELDRTRRGEWGFAVEVESGLVAAFRRTLLDGIGIWHECGSTDAMIQWVSDSPDRGALVVSDEAAVTVWRACQVSGVRAATAEDCGAVARAVRTLGVNVLVVEPVGKSIALLKQMSLTLRRGGAPRLPEGRAR